MPTIATGRIAFWEGGSLWVFDVPETPDHPERTGMHAHHAFQLSLALRGAIRLHFQDHVLAGAAVLVAPDVEHALEAHGLVANLFIEPESRLGRILSAALGENPAMAMPEIGDHAVAMEAAFRASAPSALRGAGQALMDRLAGGTPKPDQDRRVRRMIQWARDHLDSPSLSVAQAAKQVALSPSRASHLFVENTGLQFRTYVLWLRLVQAVDAHVAGMSLTQAAQEAGFSDSAHLSRTFKRMFGLPATALKIS